MAAPKNALTYFLNALSEVAEKLESDYNRDTGASKEDKEGTGYISIGCFQVPSVNKSRGRLFFQRDMETLVWVNYDFRDEDVILRIYKPKEVENPAPGKPDIEEVELYSATIVYASSSNFQTFKSMLEEMVKKEASEMGY
jgi:hypothetical protein